MEISELIALQRAFDERHGWSTSGCDDVTTVRLIARDIVGLVGEIGEFANIIKDIQLLEERPEQLKLKLEEHHEELALELVDGFVYLLRLADLIKVDLEASYLDKLKKNEEQFRRFELKN